MASDNISPLAMLNYVPLTTPVQQIMTDLPKVLPSQFYTQTKEVLGNKFRRFLMRGTRQTAKQSIYGAPPKAVAQTGIARQDVIMLHTIEQMVAGEEIIALFHQYEDYKVQLSAEEELERRAMDFAHRADNLRTATIHSAIANGYIWFDANNEILPTASGAVTTIDYQIPAGNRVAATATWATASNDIPTMVLNFLTSAMQNGYGRKPAYAICGKNVAGYLSNNTNFQQYLARNPSYNDFYKNTGLVADGVLGLKWVFAQDAYFERSDGTVPSQFPADQITFIPELTRDVYELKVGSFPVPKQFYWIGQNGDASQFVKECFNNPTYGAFRYAYGQALPVPQVWTVQGDTFYPDLPVPQSIWYYDTTP